MTVTFLPNIIDPKPGEVIKSEKPTAVTHINGSLDGSRVWFAGGFMGNHPGATRDAVWQYDAIANSWTEGIPLPQPRAGGGLQIIDGKLHYFGGFAADRDTTCGEHWKLSLIIKLALSGAMLQKGIFMQISLI